MSAIVFFKRLLFIFINSLPPFFVYFKCLKISYHIVELKSTIFFKFFKKN
uniref:Uncharacterized protein n=1 Tax=Siphoviridae sp. ctGz830 TaxID=2827825 RepID=A0A8S5T9G2_9CAUD|nr:MAG TPA: hypothetical protein [Siphoviridae sp. ctGz830]